MDCPPGTIVTTVGDESVPKGRRRCPQRVYDDRDSYCVWYYLTAIPLSTRRKPTTGVEKG